MRGRGLTAAVVLGCLALSGCTESSGPPEGSESPSNASGTDGSHIPVPTRPAEASTTTESSPALKTPSAHAQERATALLAKVGPVVGEDDSGGFATSGVFTDDESSNGMEDGTATPGLYQVRIVCERGRVRVEMGALRRSVGCAAAPTDLTACVRAKPVILRVERADRSRRELPYAFSAERIGGC